MQLNLDGINDDSDVASGLTTTRVDWRLARLLLMKHFWLDSQGICDNEMPIWILFGLFFVSAFLILVYLLCQKRRNRYVIKYVDRPVLVTAYGPETV
ncbi:unnamed protein product [Anisakis simplex]|uniref:Conserved plasma membrane protein n=1 Tax=Anisakis simplex TaxID=6269 RepID=A0A0M3K2B1_ANISI|nr:unnamed protein product [Anisakis simplex]